jgi:glycosyltransferase involved in cell wall biosynthesis
MKVSVCMTAYNQEAYIADAIESVIYQAGDFPVELIIGEDHSTDRTLDICQHYRAYHPKLIRVCPRHKNVGLGKNLALTWAECEGPYIAMLEGDDFWCSPVKLKKQVELLEAHPDYSMCFTLTNIRSDSPQRHDQWPYRKTIKDTLTATDIIRHNLIANCSVMYRKAFHYPPDWVQTLPHCDIALHVLHAMNGPIGYIPELLSTYRLHDGSYFENQPYVDRLKRATTIYRKMAKYLPPPYSFQVKQTLALMHQGLVLVEPQYALAHLRDSLVTIRELPLQYRVTGAFVALDELGHVVRSR